MVEQLPFSTLKEIEWLIDNKFREGKTLEYKGAMEFKKDHGKMVEDLSITVSSFANSIGGIIIYGIKEKRNDAHKMGIAEKVEWIPESDMTGQRLSHLLDQHIQYPIEKLQIRVITNPTSSGTAIFVVHVPESPRAPHMAFDKKYHRRTNDGTKPMEHDEVLDLMFRRQRPDLSPFIHSIDHELGKGTPWDSPIEVTIYFNLKNDGRALAKHVAGEISVQGKANRIPWELLRFHGVYRWPIIREPPDTTIQFDLEDRVIHPGSIFNAGNIVLCVPPLPNGETNVSANIIVKIMAEFMEIKEYELPITVGVGPNLMDVRFGEPKLR